MKILHDISLLETILSEYKELIGDEYLGYRNHVYRMLHFCFALKGSNEDECTEEEKTKFIIAAAFHDIGIWVANTVDYIEPSLPPMQAYLEKQNLSEWQKELSLMITEHHKVSAFEDEQFPLVEIFRQGDLVDFSCGLYKFGLNKKDIAEVRQAFANANFHKNLLKRSWPWFLRHPLNPFPMMQW